MSWKKTQGLVLSTASLSLIAAGLGAPSAIAADVTTTVNAIDNCVWQLGAVPASFLLESAEKYTGEELVLEGTTERFVVLGLAGSKEAAEAVNINAGNTTECSFYNAIENGGLTATLEEASLFTAKYGSDTSDPAMNIDLSGAELLNMFNSTATECNTTYFDVTEGPVAFTDVNQTESFLTSTAPLPNIVSAGQPNPALENYKIVCNVSTSFELKIPRRTTVPAGAGQLYTFTGPSFLFARTVTSFAP